MTSLVPTRQELTVIGIRLTVLHAAESIHRIARTDSNRASTGHPVAADLRAAADALVAGRDLVHTHDSVASAGGSDPLWASALTARPVTAALMRELSGYAPPLTRLTARLLRPARNRAIPQATRQALQDTRKWLTLTAAAHTSDPDQPGLDLNTLLLHNIPANLPPPRQPPADADLPAPELCAGATATAARLRHLAVRAASQPHWPSPSAAACWRHNALAAAIIGHNSELLLQTLADRGHQLALPGQHNETLQQTGTAMRTAWQTCQAVTRAWDPLTTGTSRRPSLIAAELDDLVMWIGRLARTGTWTPARAHAGQPRPPLDLAQSPRDITIVLVAIGRTTDAATHIIRQDMRSAEHAAAAGWIYSPARMLPESDDLTHVYHYRHASPGQIAELRAAYHHAITATETVTTALDSLLADLGAPGEPYALARALQRNPLAADPHPPNARPPTSQTAIAGRPGPGAGDIERLLHNLDITDPHLLFRAIALDHATRDLTAEALTKTQLLANLTQDAGPATGSHPGTRRKRSAIPATQDIPGATGSPTLAPTAAAGQNRSTTMTSPDSQQQHRSQQPPAHRPSRAR